MSDIKTLKQYYIDNPCSLNVENYISQLEQHNQELLKALILEVEHSNLRGYLMSRETKELFDKIKV